MAAYAALVSLMTTIEQIQSHPRLSISFDKKQIESLGEKVGFLLNFLECSSSHGGSKKEAEVLESQIASAAHAAEDVIESHVVDQIHAGGAISLLDLQRVIQDMDFLNEKVVIFKEERGFKDLQPQYPSLATLSSSPLTSTQKNTMVGFDDELIRLLDMLTGQQSSRQIISINGMGGIGKTTLARNAYDHPLIVQHFDVLAWVTISQEYNLEKVLSELLSCQRKSTSKMRREDADGLGEQLHKSLCGRRYLIVLDDMWSIEAWDRIKFYFPDTGNGSRIVVTTRLSNVVVYLGSLCLAMSFLDEDKSWNLFCETVFAQEDCPPELEIIGKKIVKKCKGLPLSIVVIGGFLKSSWSQEYWENVAKDMNSVLITGEDDQCFNILSFSYNHLPAHLKPCFLYLGIFPEDYDIRVSRLIKLWVAEGFLKPSTSRSLEEVAKGYLMDLVDRNLILVRRLGLNGKISKFYIHDLLRDLCLRIAKKENFLCAMSVLNIPPGIDRERLVVFSESIPEKHKDHVHYCQRFNFVMHEASLARSVIFEASNHRSRYDGNELSSKSRLLRVLNLDGAGTVEAFLHQVNLRYLSCRYLNMKNLELPSSLVLLWNVQTLIVSGEGLNEPIVAPAEIWEMRQLRHLKFYQLCLPDPPPSDQQGVFIVLGKLQTLLTVVDFRLSEEACNRIPNVKKLYLIYEDFSECDYCLYNLSRLSELESLSCYFRNEPNWVDVLRKNLTFPISLKKLSLANCHLQWEDMTMIGSLPLLEGVKFRLNSFVGSEWSPVEGQFLRLKYLKINMCNDLITWNADSCHFPVLEKLVICEMWCLDEIPSGIGEIPTLEVIVLFCCGVSLAVSAMKILQEQESVDNDDLRVLVKFVDEIDLESFKEQMELENITCNNFEAEVS